MASAFPSSGDLVLLCTPEGQVYTVGPGLRHPELVVCGTTRQAGANLRAAVLRVKRKGDEFGFESLEAHYRLLKPGRTPPWRLTFAAVTWGKWERWEFAHWQEFQASPMQAALCTLRSAMLPEVEMDLMCVRVPPSLAHGVGTWQLEPTTAENASADVGSLDFLLQSVHENNRRLFATDTQATVVRPLSQLAKADLVLGMQPQRATRIEEIDFDLCRIALRMEWSEFRDRILQRPLRKAFEAWRTASKEHHTSVEALLKRHSLNRAFQGWKKMVHKRTRRREWRERDTHEHFLLTKAFHKWREAARRRHFPKPANTWQEGSPIAVTSK
ncbi:unnamed protein product [Ostreobium quekettii]|uniref:Uncharacterized protein n=1 Tax=Ostreobium quekettii TaxID=121088 RepID=A0A8S1JET0_9CHLO|nr:unnamed protein product [Ostreobium quekettii]|eukprot:evm.model.scf_52.3 EVM.evm.TU.scf_52.3   scf_52:20243-25461(+)